MLAEITVEGVLVGIVIGGILGLLASWGHAIHQEADDYARYLDSLKKMHGPYDHADRGDFL
jgi:hypothetical protein